MTITPEQTVQIIGVIVAIGMSIAGVIGAYGYLVRSNAKSRYLDTESRARVAVIEAENEKDDTATQNSTIKLITDRFAKSDDLNTALQKELRECEVRSKEQDGVIKELRGMNSTLGERNQIQANLLKDSARRIKALEEMNQLQETKIRTYELKYGLLEEDK